MQLLTNSQFVRGHHWRTKSGAFPRPAFVAHAAVFGPYRLPRKVINVSTVLAAVYLVAAVVLVLDLFVWGA